MPFAALKASRPSMGTCFSKPAAARGEPDAALQRDTACDPVPADLGQIEAVIPIAWRPSGCPKVAPATTIDIDVNCKADDEFAETKAYDSPCAKDAKQSSGRRRSLKETLFPALAQPAGSTTQRRSGPPVWQPVADPRWAQWTRRRCRCCARSSSRPNGRCWT